MRSVPAVQRYRQENLPSTLPDPNNEDRPYECWSPYDPKPIWRYVWDECGQHDCAQFAIPQEAIETRQQAQRNAIEQHEREFRWVTKEINKAEEHDKTDRQSRFAPKKIRMTRSLNMDGLDLKVIDLTLPKENILEDYLVKVKNPSDDECSLCYLPLKDGPLDADGVNQPNGIKGQGIVREMPPCGCKLHLECIVSGLVQIKHALPNEGDKCPGCDRDTGTRFAVWNGAEKTLQRWHTDPQPMRYAVGGYLDLEQTVANRREAYMKVIPFRTPPDRWGNIISRVQPGA